MLFRSVEEIVVKDISKSEVLGVNKKDIEDCILIGGQRKGNKKNVRSKAMMNGRKPCKIIVSITLHNFYFSRPFVSQ